MFTLESTPGRCRPGTILVIEYCCLLSEPTMPSRAPTYYHWSQDKPATTNQTYGFNFREQISDEPRKRKDAFDYTRPFSNSAFFPAISHASSRTAPTRSCPLRPGMHVPTGRPNANSLNNGYYMGYRPITERVKRGSLPAGAKLDRTLSAPPPGYTPIDPKYKELFLWHTLSGTLVHCKNYPSGTKEC